MLSDSDVLHLCQRLGCAPAAAAVIATIRSSPPARRVRSAAGNVSVRYPSRKMGVIIQAESHRAELAGIYEMEHDPRTLAYYDQPPPIKLSYTGKHGRRLGVWHTPDFFVLRSDAIGWEEWKTEADLLRLTDLMPHRYIRRPDGTWCCPPGEQLAEPLGFTYRVRSTASINWVFQRNLHFLADYLHPDCPPVNDHTAAVVLAFVEQHPGILLADLIHHLPDIASDVLYTLIASDQLAIALHTVPLAEPDRVPVFTTHAAAEAAAHMSAAHPVHPSPCGHAPRAGSPAPAPVSRSDPLADMSIAPSEEGGTSVPNTTDRTPERNAAAHELLERASPAVLEEANRRYAIIAPILQGQTTSAATTPARTARMWLAAYRHAEATYGSGYLGLLPQWHQRGNRTARLPPTTQQLLVDTITTSYESPKQPCKAAVYGLLVRACEEQGVPPPSYKTFALAIQQRPRYAQTVQRQGPRAAYPQEPIYWDLELTTPRHGDRPFEIAHLDHTELDIELVCSRTGRSLGRPWATLLVDAFSRRVLALTLAFDPPSYRSCMRNLRHCVQRYGRLPQVLVVDGGKEFASTYLETLLARYEVIKKTRPAAKPRFGTVIERLFGTTHTTLIYNLVGNTQITREVRHITPSVDPKGHARWTLDRLGTALNQWADEVYDTTDHPALGESPRAAWAAGLVQSGARTHRHIAYDESFLLATLPTTAKGTAKVQPNLGVKISSIYYWTDAFRNPEVEGCQVPIRYDPDDIGTAYAFVQGRWMRCISEQYARLAGRSEREIQLASEELRKRRQQHTQQFAITARQLAEFLVSLEAEEVLLDQRLRDLALRDATAERGAVRPAPGHGAPAASSPVAAAPTAHDAQQPTYGQLDSARPLLTTYEDY